MKYFFDTEFIEGFHKPIFGKRRHFIDLISIGIVCEDGREYYAISKEFDKKDADAWVVENVIDKIEAELFQKQSPFAKSHFSFGLKDLLKQFGKTNTQIANDIIAFVYPDIFEKFKNNQFEFYNRGRKYGWGGEQPEFYSYYADYDWVLFCSLFGRMIDLPTGFPMYCIDLKQMMDEKGLDKEWKHENCPDPEGEHNALVDARWNRKFYQLLNSDKNSEPSVATEVK